MPYKDIEKRREYGRKHARTWRPKNRDKIRMYWQKYYYTNQDKVVARKKIQRREREATHQVRIRKYHREKIEILKKYSGQIPCCNCCGETKYEFLTLDHIIPKKNAKEITGTNLYSKLRKIKAQRNIYQVLCYNCNMGKRVNEFCPHKKSLFQTLEEWEKWSTLKVIKTPTHIKKLWKRKEC